MAATKQYIGFLEAQLRSMDEQADDADIQEARAVVVAHQRAGAYKKDAERSRRMFLSAAIVSAIGWAFAFFLLANRGFLARALLMVALIVPTFAQQPQFRRGAPYTVQPRQVMELTVPIAPKNDFIRGVVAYHVTLRYFDGIARFETLHKLVFAPKCEPGGQSEGAEAKFEVPIGFRDEKVTIERLIVDSKETLP